MKSIHRPVLLNETVESLTSGQAKKPVDSRLAMPWYLDGTLGGGGHALALADALGGRVEIVGLDREEAALKRAAERLSGAARRLILECEDFRNLDAVLDRHGIQGIDMMLLDLGLSSDELESSGKGFSFMRDEPLSMTMGEPDRHPFTAKTIVNNWNEEDIANVIYAYGEERFARKIARAIVAYREKKAIESSGELSEIIRSAVPPFARKGKTNPSTKTFQALRIAVNDELSALKEGLSKGYDRLNAGGRLAVISFHSLEDRIVKDFFKEKSAKDGKAAASKKPVKPSQGEIASNPRARSAKLRVLEKKQ